jgi:aminoglycoside phosphotransferase (APT) family kinase protein
MSQFEDQATRIRQGEELDVPKLEGYLREHFPDEKGSLIVEQFPSGHSNLTYSLRFGEMDLVLRRPPFGSKVKSAHDMGREYRVLSKLHAAFPPAPQPLCYDEEGSVIGAPFYVMRRIPGVILRKQLPAGLEISPLQAEQMGYSFIDTLAQLHRIDFEAIGLGELGRPVGYVQRQVEGWIKRYAGSRTHDLPEIEPITQWLPEHMPAEYGAALIHNDYKYDNTILDPDDITRIVGVLDWEMCTLGDPLMDLGTAISYWIEATDPPDVQFLSWGPTTLPGCPTRKQLVNRYADQMGIDPPDMTFYLAFAHFKTAVIAQQIYYRFHHGKTQDQRFAMFIEATKILLKAAVRTIETGRI